MTLCHKKLVELFHFRQQVRAAYVAIATQRDATPHPNLISCAHLLYAALTELDNLLDQEQLSSCESAEISRLLEQSHEAIKVLSDGPAVWA
jgi:hypothetical protein